MAKDAGEQETTHILHRPISKRAMEIILVLLLVSIVFLVVIAPVTCSHHRHPRWIRDLSNVQQVVAAINAYAADHDGLLPTHIKEAEDYWSDDDVFYSRFDYEDALVFDETITPGWYVYGSYWFLFAEDLSLDDIEKPNDFIVVYRAPRLDHDFYVVGYLDGATEMLDSQAFAEHMKQQERALIQPQER